MIVRARSCSRETTAVHFWATASRAVGRKLLPAVGDLAPIRGRTEPRRERQLEHAILPSRTRGLRFQTPAPALGQIITKDGGGSLIDKNGLNDRPDGPSSMTRTGVSLRPRPPTAPCRPRRYMRAKRPRRSRKRRRHAPGVLVIARSRRLERRAGSENDPVPATVLVDQAGRGVNYDSRSRFGIGSSRFLPVSAGSGLSGQFFPSGQSKRFICTGPDRPRRRLRFRHSSDRLLASFSTWQGTAFSLAERSVGGSRRSSSGSAAGIRIRSGSVNGKGCGL